MASDNGNTSNVLTVNGAGFRVATINTPDGATEGSGPTDAPLAVHGNDLLDGGDGDYRLRQKLDVELAAAARTPRAIRMGVAI